jgi:alpha-L-arabinofuranosidase
VRAKERQSNRSLSLCFEITNKPETQTKHEMNLTRKRAVRFLLIGALSITAVTTFGQGKQLTVNTDKIVAPIQPTMWGIFFEDINFAADGGLYAELVKNRSFEFDVPLMGWTEVNSNRFAVGSNAGKAMIINRGTGYANPRFARVGVLKDTGYALTNEGFRGMGVTKNNSYTFTMLASQLDGNTSVRVQLIDSKGSVVGQAQVKPDSKDWKKYTAKITSSATDPKAKLSLVFEGKGVLDLDMVSLFPTETWKDRPNGLRKDLVQLLADLKPGFVRFPGGCIVEGRDLAQRYQWKKTVGKPEDRELIINRWNTEFAHRPAPDYFQSYGLGFYEYFELAEDIGASPLPILSCGLACQFNTAEVVPMEDLDPYVQDALDLIEFANGDGTTKWGALRAAMGHPASFNMTMIGVGNEQWGPQYIERYKVFAKAIKAKYPNIKIVSGTGPSPDGELFDFAAKELKTLNAEIVDEHYYAKPDWFFRNATRYDSYDRKGYKIFAGEYAAQSLNTVNPDNKNNWICALSEAAFMTGLERNAEVVHMCSYAPLLAHAEAWQWTPDLIWFDNLHSYATPNYYVQQLYSTNKGTDVLTITSGKEKVVPTGQDGLYASAVFDKKTKEIIVKVVNASDKAQSTEVNLSGGKKPAGDAQLITLTSNDLEAVNSFEDPAKIKPVVSAAKVSGKKITLNLQPHSFTVIKMKTK